ncbi:hypothetical protein PFISCL1PPCAC_5480, partial [Pristionchus fissidentatus]
AMGGGGSKGDYNAGRLNQLEHEMEEMRKLYEARITMMAMKAADHEEQRRRQDEAYNQQVKDAQNRAMKREEQLRDDLRQMENRCQTAKDESEKLSREERMQMRTEYIQKVRDTEQEMRALRENAAKELNNLREKQEEKEKMYKEEVKELMEKRVEQEHFHNAQMMQLRDKVEVEIRTLYREIIAANNLAHDANANLLTYRSEMMSLSTGIIHNVAAHVGSDKDSDDVDRKLRAIREVISRMDSNHKKIIEWILVNEDGDDWTAISTARAVNSVRACLQAISEDCGEVDLLIDKLKASLAGAHFAHNLCEQGKLATISIKAKSRELYTEVTKIRGKLVNRKNSMDLDDFSEMERCIVELELTIENFPSMKNQTMTEFIDQQLEKLQMKDREFFKKESCAAIPTGEERMPIIELP